MYASSDVCNNAQAGLYPYQPRKPLQALLLILCEFASGLLLNALGRGFTVTKIEVDGLMICRDILQQ